MKYMPEILEFEKLLEMNCVIVVIELFIGMYKSNWHVQNHLKTCKNLMQM